MRHRIPCIIRVGKEFLYIFKGCQCIVHVDYQFSLHTLWHDTTKCSKNVHQSMCLLRTNSKWSKSITPLKASILHTIPTGHLKRGGSISIAPLSANSATENVDNFELSYKTLQTEKQRSVQRVQRLNSILYTVNRDKLRSSL